MKTHIPVFSLQKHHALLRPWLQRAFDRVVSRGLYTLGVEVSAFEAEFAAYIGMQYGIGVGTGTDAITLALRALNLKKGDSALLPANSYPSVFGVQLALATTESTLKLCDVGVDGLVTVESLKNYITPSTKVVILVHLYGNTVDILGIQQYLKTIEREDIYIVEDCAQAAGAWIDYGDRLSVVGGRKRVGSFGILSCFSFYPSKNLGALGDGGMILTNDLTIAERVRHLRMYGEVSRYHSETISGVSRLDELQAAFLREELLFLDDWNKRRTTISKYYVQQFSDIQGISCVPFADGSCHHLFVVRVSDRNRFMEYMRVHGVDTSIHYPIAIHQTKSFAYLGYQKGDFPITEQLCEEVVSLPLYPELTDEEMNYVVQTVKDYFAQ